VTHTLRPKMSSNRSIVANKYVRNQWPKIAQLTTACPNPNDMTPNIQARMIPPATSRLAGLTFKAIASN